MPQHMSLLCEILLASSLLISSTAFRSQIHPLRIRHLSFRTPRMSNAPQPESNEKRKKNIFDQISPDNYDDNQINDETISRDFLPSGPADLATIETTRIQNSELLSKRYTYFDTDTHLSTNLSPSSLITLIAAQHLDI